MTGIHRVVSALNVWTGCADPGGGPRPHAGPAEVVCRRGLSTGASGRYMSDGAGDSYV